MTRETKLLIDMWDILHRECHKVVTEENYDAIKKSIKALEQEPKTDILGKIRAEIEELKPNNPNFKGYFEQNVALNKVLEVIDKYKAESEDKE